MRLFGTNCQYGRIELNTRNSVQYSSMSTNSIVKVEYNKEVTKIMIETGLIIRMKLSNLTKP